MGPTSTTHDEIIKAVELCYGRCCLKQGFFDEFYTNFLASDPRLAPMFAHTDMARQKQLLRQGITFLIQYAKGSPIASKKIAELTASHAKSQYNIKPTLYPLWTSALLKTIEANDAQFNPTLRGQWHEVLTVGIDAMSAGYQA